MSRCSDVTINILVFMLLFSSMNHWTAIDIFVKSQCAIYGRNSDRNSTFLHHQISPFKIPLLQIIQLPLVISSDFGNDSINSSFHLKCNIITKDTYIETSKEIRVHTIIHLITLEANGTPFSTEST